MTRQRSVERACVGLATVVVTGASCQTHQRLVRQDEVVIVHDLRAVRSAEAAYEAANGGFPDILACLSKPQECIPNFPRHAPPFVSASLANLVTENGYVREFHPGPAAPRDACQPHLCSPSSLAGWAYTAVPAGERGKRKSFCVDHTGRMCSMLDGTPPPVVNGQCPSPCDRIP